MASVDLVNLRFLRSLDIWVSPVPVAGLALIAMLSYRGGPSNMDFKISADAGFGRGRRAAIWPTCCARVPTPTPRGSGLQGLGASRGRAWRELRAGPWALSARFPTPALSCWASGRSTTRAASLAHFSHAFDLRNLTAASAQDGCSREAAKTVDVVSPWLVHLTKAASYGLAGGCLLSQQTAPLGSWISFAGPR